MEQLGSHRTNFYEIWHLDISRKTVENIQVSWKSDKNNRYCTWRPADFFIISCSVLLRMTNVSDENCRRNQTHILCSITFFFRKSWRLWDNVENYCRVAHATDDSMAHARCVLDNEGYKHTLAICNTYCFSTATMIVRTCLIVTLYVHCLSCLWLFSFPARSCRASISD